MLYISLRMTSLCCPDRMKSVLELTLTHSTSLSSSPGLEAPIFLYGSGSSIQLMTEERKTGEIVKYINTILGRALHSTHPYVGLPVAKFLDQLKGSLAPLMPNTTLRWIEAEVPIEKRHHNSIQNESILCHPMAACLRAIIPRKSIDLGLLIE
ncbi:hypothetical protein H5410_002156 [Solanum commersonii]|uniref:Uncharacterized protein n=1 Tax=Solanum commersonii TaxID=4109 RepID=A0A9J6B235_SOLCO|nr:hypothetical protein H5410_002156 [Solanum commersonii]